MSISLAIPPEDLDPQTLRKHASHIRDVLDPKVAREGPESLHPDEVLFLHDLLVSLQLYNIPVSTLEISRIHNAILEIAGKATRWPSRLANECDDLISSWEARYGKLKDIIPIIFGVGGRLHGVCHVTDVTRSALLRRWTRHTPVVMEKDRAMKIGSLGFEPGKWWISGMFAFFDGITNLRSTDGGICCDKKGAYAIVLHSDNEIPGPTADEFTYRCKLDDPGRFRLTQANSASRHPIRVLRTHSQSCLWAPKVGVRYDGLYRVTGWRVMPMNRGSDNSKIVYEVHLRREPDQKCVNEVLSHPLADELDDYIAYKKLRKQQRDNMRDQAAGQKPKDGLVRITSGKGKPPLPQIRGTNSSTNPLSPSLMMSPTLQQQTKDIAPFEPLNRQRTAMLVPLSVRPSPVGDAASLRIRLIDEHPGSPLVPVICPLKSRRATADRSLVWKTSDGTVDYALPQSISSDRAYSWPSLSSNSALNNAPSNRGSSRCYIGDCEEIGIARANFEARCDDYPIRPQHFLNALNAVHTDIEKPEYVDMPLKDSSKYVAEKIKVISASEQNWNRAMACLTTFSNGLQTKERVSKSIIDTGPVDEDGGDDTSSVGSLSPAKLILADREPYTDSLPNAFDDCYQSKERQATLKRRYKEALQRAKECQPEFVEIFKLERND